MSLFSLWELHRHSQATRLKRQARQLAKKRAGDNFDYVVVSP